MAPLNSPIEVFKLSLRSLKERTEQKMCKDWFMTYPVRIFGLGVAIGEALRYVLAPGWTSGDVCSIAACTFILTHAACQAYQAHIHGASMVLEMFDSLIFDGFASVLFPYLLTYHACKITLSCLKEGSAVPDVILAWGPTIVGLCALSLTTESIDKYVDDCMSDSIRKFY